jgi:hypothetical protein
MPKSKSESHDIEQLTVRFPKGLLDILRESAEENDRSLNAEIVNAARSRVNSYQRNKQEKTQHELVGSREN